MKRRLAVWLLALVAAFSVRSEVTEIGGVAYECADGVCRPVDGSRSPAADPFAAFASVSDESAAPARLAQGYMGPEAFRAFLRNASASADAPSAPTGLLFALVLAFLGGLALNLTPCVLPMVPVTLIVIGRSVSRGLWYGAGMTVAYGALGLLASLGGGAFGEIQSSPWFNVAIAGVFVVLALSLAGLFRIDFSSWRKPRAGAGASGGFFVPFSLGAVGALLAGACVAPVLISVLVLTARFQAEGRAFAWILPFALGLGLASPWPFLGAGLKILPKPGRWMAAVNRVFAFLVFGFACWYAALAVAGFRHRTPSGGEGRSDLVPSELSARLADLPRPVLVDCWASWCKNCAAMDRVTFADPAVAEELKRFSVLRMRCEDLGALRALPGCADIKGLPAFLVFE